MAAAATSGHAAPLSPIVTFVMRYQHAWWVYTQAGWIPVPTPIVAILDEHVGRMRCQDARNAAIRAVIELARSAAIAPGPSAGPEERSRQRQRRRPAGRKTR